MGRIWFALAFLVTVDAAVAQQRTLGASGTDNAAVFRGQIGRRVTYACPARLSLTASLWGTDVYTDDSPLCLSAIHAGVLQAGQAGAVTLVIGGTVATFEGSTRYGVTSRSYSSYPSSMTFDNSGEPGQVDWTTTGQAIPAEITTPILVSCPPRGSPTASVWGTDVYTDDSAICVAAVHAGVISVAAGGRVGVLAAPGQASYTASLRNGVSSQAYGAYERSFRVAAAQDAAPATSITTVTGIGVRVTSVGLSTVSWNAVPDARGYVVARWRSDDATCCNNVSPPGSMLTATAWVDSILLPRPGTYGYRVYASTSTGVVAGETTVNWDGTDIETPLFTRTGGTVIGSPLDRPTGTLTEATATTAPVEAVAVDTTAPTQSGTAQVLSAAPADAPNPASTTAGRYRAVLAGVSVQTPTKDNLTRTDGFGDEIAVAAVTMVWDRRNNEVQQRGFVATVEHGDTAVAMKAPDRIAAGSARASGGLVEGDVVPAGFVANQATAQTSPGTADPTLATAAAAAAGSSLPLVVWEGVLNDGVDVLLVVPSIWERDVTRVPFDLYRSSWLNAPPTEVINFATLQIPLPGVSVSTSAVKPGLPTLLTLTDLAAQLIDRPLGLTPAPLVEPYHDRFVLVTREKLSSLSAAGSATELAIDYTEPNADPILGGNYRLHLRLERLE